MDSLVEKYVHKSTQATYPDLPYNAFSMDCTGAELRQAVALCLRTPPSQPAAAHRGNVSKRLSALWAPPAAPSPALPVLCVRAAWDLWLRVMAFPPGSQVLMSAVNIPDMSIIARHHQLEIVPVDIDLATLSPRIDLLERLTTSKTVVFLVAHLCGRRVDMNPIINFASKRDILVVEDCAEAFCGFSWFGHPQTDLVLFSFGVIKFSTSFGGGIVKVKDEKTYCKMCKLYSTYPVQTNSAYLKKLLKYSILYAILQVKPFPQMIQLSRRLGKDWKDTFVSYIRGFPDKDTLIEGIRTQPSTPLLTFMLRRHLNFDAKDFDLQRIKGDYFLSKLDSRLYVAGTEVKVNNYWLFPVISEDPDLLVSCLGSLGVDAYRGATQLNVVEPSRQISFNRQQKDQVTTPAHDKKNDDSCAFSSELQPLSTHLSLSRNVYQSNDSDLGTNLISPSSIPTTLTSSVPSLSNPFDNIHMNASERQHTLIHRHLKSENEKSQDQIQYATEPHTARYFANHVVYLPVNKWVPFYVLDHMAQCCHRAARGLATPTASLPELARLKARL